MTSVELANIYALFGAGLACGIILAAIPLVLNFVITLGFNALWKGG